MFFRTSNRFSRQAERSAPDSTPVVLPTPAESRPTRHSGFHSPRHLFTFLRATDTLQTVARGVLAVWLAPVAFAFVTAFMLAGKPAPLQAQGAGQTVIVLDFAVQPGTDPVLGRKAADALAVELQSAGGHEVVSRQQVEEAIAKTPGMLPPFDGSTQVRLAQVVGARSIFSGRVLRTEVAPRKSASATVELRQLDVNTGDYINGVVVTEVTTDKLGQVDNEVLLDEALNKAIYTAWRTMRSRHPIEGQVLNVTLNDAETNIGTRNGVSIGQRYSVLRDVYDKARNVTERIKVAEMTIGTVEADASVGTVVAGTSARTGDRLREIFVPAAYPVTPANSGSFPILPKTRVGGTPSVVKKTGSTLYGLLALAGLVGLAGFAGGSSGNRAGETAPSNVQPRAAATAGGDASINVSFNRGISGILATDNIVGYLIYRGESENFAPSARTLHEFIRTGNQSTILFSDDADRPLLRTVTIEVEDPDTGGGTGGGTGGSSCADASSGISVEDLTEDADTDTTTTGNTLTVNSDGLEAEFTQSPVVPGRQYFYKATRLTVTCSEQEEDTGTGGGTGGGTGETTATLTLVESNPSATGGGATALPQPVIVDTNRNLDNLSIQIEAQIEAPPEPGPTPSATPSGTPLPTTIDAFAGADEFLVQVSVTSSFSDPRNFYQQPVENPALGGEDTITLILGNPIVVPNFIPGETTRVFVRVGARNTTDVPGSIVFSRPFAINNPTGGSLTSRFLPSGSGARTSRGLGLPGDPRNGLLRGGGGRKPSTIRRFRVP